MRLCYFGDVEIETETHRDWDIYWMSRLRLITRMGNIMDVVTDTSLDWAKDVDTKTPSRLLLISGNEKEEHI